MFIRDYIDNNWAYVFEYDPEGFIIWIDPPSLAVAPGTKVTYVSSGGYRQVKYKGVTYTVSRIIWEIHHGPIPDGLEIDHIDRDRTNDKIDNLRLATRAENLANKGDYSNNTSGYKGVNFNKTVGKWQARANTSGKRISLGYFETIEEAIDARRTWEATN